MKTILLTFQREDFLGNSYVDNHDCGISRAAKRHFDGIGRVFAVSDGVCINNQRYSFGNLVIDGDVVENKCPEQHFYFNSTGRVFGSNHFTKLQDIAEYTVQFPKAHIELIPDKTF